MKKLILTSLFAIIVIAAYGKGGQEMDTIKTSEGDLIITFIGHASLIFNFKGSAIFVDPYGALADYTALGKADLVLITHEHPDHLDLTAVKKITKKGTVFFCNEASSAKLPGSHILKNGESQNFKGIRIVVVPAYNIVHKRDSGEPFHVKGSGNGYVITFADKKIYIAGDTENIPEMKKLKDIYCAFLPMNIPYTMTPEMAADAAKMIQPKILYPYHFGETDTSKLVALLKDEKEIEVRIRRMK
jgi:L-ascorbate metabolism protein UlaG (beta-lactamase superfamily)